MGMSGTKGDDDDNEREVETSSTKDSGKTRKNHPSLISLAIARTASKPAGVFSMDAKNLIPGLYTGVLLNDDKTKFWIDEKLHKNCFMMFPKALTISWVEDNNYWTWSACPEDCFGGSVDIDIPELVYVYWLDILGKLPSTMLSPMTTYEVVLVLKVKARSASSWQIPVNFNLGLPNGTTHDRTLILGKKQTEQWLEIPFCEFMTSPEMVGYINFSVTEHSTVFRKEGIVVKGVLFRPKD